MATLRRWALLGTGTVLLACSKPVGLDAPVTALAQIHVQTTGEVAAQPDVDGGASPPHLHVALVWGLQWLPEPFCVLPAESPAAAAVQRAGCRDSFGFVPDRVGADVPIEPGVPATLPLVSLPAADVMVGDLTARIAYASLIVYDDRNLDGVLDLRHPPRQRQRGEPITDAAGLADVIYGASFSAMTRPDRRVAYREGTFDPSAAFYPRPGCSPTYDPPPGFSIPSAGGMSESALLPGLLTGQLPPESSCGLAPIDDLVEIATSSPEPASPIDGGQATVPDLSQLACTSNDSGGVTYYRKPPATLSLDDPHLVWACTSFPRLPGDTVVAQGQQLVTARLNQPCRATLHYTLRGCDNNPTCATPNWDLTAASDRPAWWPCQATP